jgi:hypothetical protein
VVPCGRLQRLGAVENLGGKKLWESLGGRTKPGLQAVLRGEVAPTMANVLPAVHTPVTRALGRGETILVLEAPTVIIARDLPIAEMTGEVLVDGKEQAEAGGEVVIRDPAAVVMTIVAEGLDRPTVATMLLAMIHAEAATIGMRAGVIHVGIAVEAAVIPDDLEAMTIARCGVRRLRLAIVHLPVAEEVSGEMASARAPVPTGHAPATEPPPIQQLDLAEVGARVSTLSEPIVCASRV